MTPEEAEYMALALPELDLMPAGSIIRIPGQGDVYQKASNDVWHRLDRGPATPIHVVARFDFQVLDIPGDGRVGRWHK
jgi:hypothetical protein